MSEPTYRVELEHHPHDEDWPWAASVIRVSDELPLFVRCGSTREDAFDRAQQAIRVMGQPQAPSSVYLSEDGDILDPHEVQR